MQSIWEYFQLSNSLTAHLGFSLFMFYLRRHWKRKSQPAKWYLNAWLYDSLIQLMTRSASISLYPGVSLGERGGPSSPHVLPSPATRQDSLFTLPQAERHLNLPIKTQVVRCCGTLGSLSLNSKPLPRRVPDKCTPHGGFCIEDSLRPQHGEGNVNAKTAWNTAAADAEDLRLT